MPNPLTEARGQLAAELAADDELRVYSSPPGEDVDYPLVYVVPGVPYLSRPVGLNFGADRVRCSVVVVAAAGDHVKRAEELDDLVLRVVDMVDESAAWILEEVDQPGMVTIANAAHLAVSIDVYADIDRS